MIRSWLDLSAPSMFAMLAALYFGIALLLTLAVFKSPIKGPLQSLTGIVAPFFGSVALLFALLTGFLANDVSDRSRLSVRAVQAEAGELRNLYTLSVASISDMHSIRTKWKAYVGSVVSEEWPAMAQGLLSPPTYVAYDDLLREVSNPAIAKDAGQAVHAAMLNAAIRVGTARSDPSRFVVRFDQRSEMDCRDRARHYYPDSDRPRPSRAASRIRRNTSGILKRSYRRSRNHRASGISVLRTAADFTCAHLGTASVERVTARLNGALVQSA